MFDDLIDTFSFMSSDMRVSHIGTVGNVVVIAANFFVIIALGISTATLAFSFIQFITSTGDKKMVEKAQKSLQWSVIGIFVSLVIFSFKTFLLKFLGVSGVE